MKPQEEHDGLKRDGCGRQEISSGHGTFVLGSVAEMWKGRRTVQLGGVPE